MTSQLKQWIKRATETADAPGPQSDIPVKVLGEALTEPVQWAGREWAVTAYGIEARDGKYAIEGKRVWEDEDSYGWVRHMEEKEWVDMPDFVEALRIARKRWPRN